MRRQHMLPISNALCTDRSAWERQYPEDTRRRSRQLVTQRSQAHALKRMREEEGLETAVDGMYRIKDLMEREHQRAREIFSEHQLRCIFRHQPITLSRRQEAMLEERGWEFAPLAMVRGTCLEHETSSYIKVPDGYWIPHVQLEDIGVLMELGSGCLQVALGARQFFTA